MCGVLKSPELSVQSVLMSVHIFLVFGPAFTFSRGGVPKTNYIPLVEDKHIYLHIYITYVTGLLVFVLIHT